MVSKVDSFRHLELQRVPDEVICHSKDIKKSLRKYLESYAAINPLKYKYQSQNHIASLDLSRHTFRQNFVNKEWSRCSENEDLSCEGINRQITKIDETSIEDPGWYKNNLYESLVIQQSNLHSINKKAMHVQTYTNIQDMLKGSLDDLLLIDRKSLLELINPSNWKTAKSVIEHLCLNDSGCSSDPIIKDVLNAESVIKLDVGKGLGSTTKENIRFYEQTCLDIPSQKSDHLYVSLQEKQSPTNIEAESPPLIRVIAFLLYIFSLYHRSLTPGNELNSNDFSILQNIMETDSEKLVSSGPNKCIITNSTSASTPTNDEDTMITPFGTPEGTVDLDFVIREHSYKSIFMVRVNNEESKIDLNRNTPTSRRLLRSSVDSILYDFPDNMNDLDFLNLHVQNDLTSHFYSCIQFPGEENSNIVPQIINDILPSNNSQYIKISSVKESNGSHGHNSMTVSSSQGESIEKKESSSEMDVSPLISADEPIFDQNNEEFDINDYGAIELNEIQRNHDIFNSIRQEESLINRSGMHLGTWYSTNLARLLGLSGLLEGLLLTL